MSNEITCKTCGYENPHSSKFCNNCGTKLPLSTHIICPNCETPNTRDRVFCDSCGTRLLAETTQLKPEEPEESQEPPSKPFSLPTRRPGDTGELNPSAVPDWLRTGDIESEKAEDGAPSPTDAKGESDLPDWLVHDSDPEPIINAPTNISTEFYQDLLERAEEDLPQPDDLFADEGEADLPDWLSEADAPPADAAAESGEGLTDWLSDLADDSAEETADSAKEAEEDISTGLTDWLQELDDLSNPAEVHAEENAAALDNLLDEQAEEPVAEAAADDWLSELGPAQTDVLDLQDDDAQAETADDPPGWMEELGSMQTNLLDPSQIAELTGPLTGMSDDADLVDDEEAGADVSFTSLFETTEDATGPLPDWLESDAEDESFLTDSPEDTPDLELLDTLAATDEPSVVEEAGSDWFTADQVVAETDLDWLADTGRLDTVAEGEDAVTDLAQSSELQDDFSVSEDEFSDLADSTGDEPDEVAALQEADSTDDDFDWLSDMEAIQTGELIIEPEIEMEEPDVPQEPLAEAEEPEPEPIVAEEPDDSWSSDSFLDEESVSDDLPDWLEQLEDTGQTAESTAPDSPGEELPDWVASMKPSEGFIGSELPGVFSEADIRDTLEGIPEELAGAALPDWLQDSPIDGVQPTQFVDADSDETVEIPDWLQPGLTESETAETPSEPLPEPAQTGSSRNEWNALLDELPPLTPLAESLPKAEIPDWVQELKPPELTGAPPRELEGPEVTVGPLKGMGGIMPIEPAIAKPRTALPLAPYTITPEQQQQVALLRQITQETPETTTLIGAKTAYDTAVWLRLSVAVLLIGAVLAGLLGLNVSNLEAPIPANIQAVDAAVAAAAGQPVLLAVEYTPAMAAELSPQAELLLTQLEANGSPVLLTSQYAAGTAVANNLAVDGDAQQLGYLPGEGVGLRQLGDCLAGRNQCDQLNGRMLPEELRTNLSQTSLIIVLTGDRDNLVNWVEQVGSVATNVPIAAGVTQALTPLASSYAATGQLSGLLSGVPDAATYAQIVQPAEESLLAQQNAQIIGQLLAATLLIIGLLVYGIQGVMNSRREKK